MFISPIFKKNKLLCFNGKQIFGIISSYNQNFLVSTINFIRKFDISVKGELPWSKGINSMYDKPPSCFPPPIMPFEHQVHIKTPLLIRLYVPLVEMKVISPARYTVDFSSGVSYGILKPLKIRFSRLLFSCSQVEFCLKPEKTEIV